MMHFGLLTVTLVIIYFSVNALGPLGALMSLIGVVIGVLSWAIRERSEDDEPQ